MIALGLDPSLTAFGYAVLERPAVAGQLQLRSTGVWQTSPGGPDDSKSADNMKRFAYITEGLWDLAQREKPTILYVEGLVYMKQTNFSALSSAGRCRGLVDMLGQVLQVPVIELSPQAVKTGLGIVRAPKSEGMASKGEVRDRVCRIYANAAELIPKGKVGENASDAIAVAHVGIVREQLRERATAW